MVSQEAGLLLLNLRKSYGNQNESVTLETEFWPPGTGCGPILGGAGGQSPYMMCCLIIELLFTLQNPGRM